MNILITGANGQLGREIRIVSKYSTDKFIFTDVNQVEDLETIFLDITDIESIRSMIISHNIKCIINCAAYTNVDEAETNEILAERLNAEAPRNLAIVMKEVNGLLIHISTDYVFGKEACNTPCNESQNCAPNGVYGLTKFRGEQNIIACDCEHLIIRTSWLYSEFGKNFCKTMLNLTATKPTLKVVFDQVGTPTYAYDLASTIIDIIENRKYTGNKGIYHYSNEGVCSWYDFAKMIAEYSNQRDCDIQPCHSNEFPSPVNRPSYSVLDKTKIKETFGIKVPYWLDSLKACINNLKDK